MSSSRHPVSSSLFVVGGADVARQLLEAGGYQPLDHTPEIWARVVERIYTHLSD
jgi:hypothetical protein